MEGGGGPSPPIPTAPEKKRRSKKSKQQPQQQQREPVARPADVLGASNKVASLDRDPGAKSERASSILPVKPARGKSGTKRRRESIKGAQLRSVKPTPDLGSFVSYAADSCPRAVKSRSASTPTPTPSACALQSSLAVSKADSPSSKDKEINRLDAPSFSGGASPSTPTTPGSESCSTPQEPPYDVTAKPQAETQGETDSRKEISLPSPLGFGLAENNDETEQHSPQDYMSGQSSWRHMPSLWRPAKDESVVKPGTSRANVLRAKLPFLSGKNEKPQATADVSPKAAFTRRAPMKPPAKYYESMVALASSHQNEQQQKFWDISRLQRTPLGRKHTAILAIIVSVTIASLLFGRPWKFSPEPRELYNACTTEVCYRHATYFKDSLNYSADPCVDFDAFTCSRWKPRVAFSPSFILDMRRKHMEHMANRLLYQEPHFNASVLVSAFLRECVTDNGELKDMSQFRDFTRDLGIPWPYVSPSPGYNKSVHPLRVVFELSMRWHMRTWFSVWLNPLHPTRETKGAFYVDEISYPSELLTLVRTLEWHNAREVYYWQFCSLYNVTAPKRAELRRLFRTETSILAALDTIRTTKRLLISEVTPSDLAALTINVSLDDWIELVRQFAPNVGAPGRFVFYVSNMAIIGAVSQIFFLHKHADILEHLSWWLTQQYAVLASPRALQIIGGNRENAKVLKSIYCYDVAVQKFNALLFAESAFVEFSESEREQVSNQLQQLLGLAEKFARLLPWSEAGLKYVARKLTELEVIVWPKRIVDLDSALSAMYADFLTVDGVKEPSFMDYWRHASQKMLSMSDYDWMEFTRHIPKTGIFEFDLFNNKLTVLQAALHQPLYYPDNVDLQAANFGGLGVSFLSYVFRIFNPSVIRHDVKDEIEGLFTERGLKLAMADDCGSAYGYRVMDLLALAAAWSEFKRPRRQKQSGHGSSLLNIQSFREIRSFTDEQVFFLTYCRTLCTTQASHACNIVLRHLGAFGTAFRCEKGTPMRAPHHCGLLQVVDDALKNQTWLLPS